MKTAKIASAPAPSLPSPDTEAGTEPLTSAALTLEDLNVLRAPFTNDRLGVKVQSFSKDRTRAMLVLYLQHTDVQDRLEEVDPAWSIQVMAEERAGDTVYARARLTLKGVSRENVGEGGDPKAAQSDALKRCAMLFGVGRYLYDMPTVWTEYEDSRDRFRQWSVEDYDAAFKGKRPEAPARTGSSKPAPSAAPEAAARPKIKAKTPTVPSPAAPDSNASFNESGPIPRPGLTTSTSGARPREELNRILMNLYLPYLNQFPDTQFAKLLQERYTVAETRLMSVEQLEDLVLFMEAKLQSVA